MRAEDHQGQWFNFGVVLFGGGVVVSADWVFAVQSAPHANHLSYTQWPIILWVVMVGGGIYVMLASYIEKWPLPGKKRVKDARDLKFLAEGILTLFRVVGASMLNVGDATQDEIADWGLSVKRYVFSAWGAAEGGAIHGAMFQNPTEKTIIDVNAYLDGLVARCPILVVQKDFTSSGEWRKYLDNNRFLPLDEKGVVNRDAPGPK